MARDYGRIRTSFWDDDRIKPLPMAEKMVAAYLLTSNHTNAIGCFKLPLAYVADDLGVTTKSLEPIFAALRGINFIKWCERVPWLWIPNYLKHNPPETPNVWRRCVAEMKLLPVEISARAHIAEELFAIAAEERMKTITAEERTKLQAFCMHAEGINHASAMHEPCTTRARPVPSPGPGPSPGPVPGPEEETSKPVEARAEARRPPKGTRWPSEAVVPEDWLRDAEASRRENGLVDMDLTLEALKFQNYWASKSGGSSTKLDWQKTWINWCLKAEPSRNKPKESAHDKGTRAAARLIAELEAGNTDRDHHGARPPILALPSSRHDRGQMASAFPDVLRGPEGQDIGPNPDGLPALASGRR